jgi:hypothetical protein
MVAAAAAVYAAAASPVVFHFLKLLTIACWLLLVVAGKEFVASPRPADLWPRSAE